MRTLILDCNNIAYIARHAFGEDLSHEEEQTGVLWGFFNQIWKLAKQFETNKFLFAWDSRKSLRKQEYQGYKANRRVSLTKGQVATEDKVYAQFSALRKNLLPAFGFKNIYMCTGLEADDIVAALVLNNEWAEPPVVISTDKDLYQLLSNCDIWRPLPKGQKYMMTHELFCEKYKGLKPEAWVQVRALEGDSSDNLSGVGGCGSILALKYLQGKLPKESKIRKRIVSAEGQIIMQRNIRLMKLPHPKTPTFPVESGESFFVDDFITICDRYGFNYFLRNENLREWRNLFNMED